MGFNDLEQSCQNEQQDRLHFGRKIELTDYMPIDHDIYIHARRARNMASTETAVADPERFSNQFQAQTTLPMHC